MCFSATASFVACGATGTVGLITILRARGANELPLATIPLLFSAQQGVEGLLWLTLPIAPEGPASSLLTHLFLLIATVVWPVYGPLAVLLIEPDPLRRRLVGGCLAIGLGLAGYTFWYGLTSFPAASIVDGRIVYSGEPGLSYAIAFLYLMATGMAPLLSSRRIVSLFGAMVMLGTFVTYAFYWEAFISVWCFFAALGSVAILAHFEILRRLRRAAV
jgi:hypothetical protein